MEFLKELGAKEMQLLRKLKKFIQKEKDISQSLDSEIEQIVNKIKSKCIEIKGNIWRK